MRQKIRMACVSDVHLGHPKNPTERIIANLNRHISNDSFLKTIDLLIIAGDLFDRLLAFASDEARAADMWISNLLRRCARNNVRLRVLRGTPSHDRNQSSRFVDNNDKLVKAKVKNADLRYVDVLEIEHFDDWDIDVLYLPDEWGATPEDALDQAQKLIESHGLERVDFAVMHGMFDYQLDVDIPSIPRHSSAAWLDLVKYLIFIGHVHVFSTFERIIAQGSFDRLAHNEEGPKGFVVAEVDPNGDYTSRFIENVGAMKFVTIDVDNPDLPECLLHIEARIANLPDFSYVRVRSAKEHPIQSNLALLKSKWVMLNWTLHVNVVKTEKISEVLAAPTPTYTPIKVDRHTLLPVMTERLARKNYPRPHIDECVDILSELRSVIT